MAISGGLRFDGCRFSVRLARCRETGDQSYSKPLITMGNEATFRATPTPIRHSLRTYTPQEIAALNEELGRKGVAAFRPAEELLADISAGKQPTRTSAPGWFYHPDERVQLALLEREELTPVPSFNFYADKNFRLLAIWAVA